MFQELMPLLGQRIVIIALSRVSDDEMRINVVPMSEKPPFPRSRSRFCTIFCKKKIF